MWQVMRAGRLGAFVVMLGLAGCAQLGPASGPRPMGASTAPVGGTCNAQAAQWALGRSGTARVVEEARARAGARMARVVHAGQPAQAPDAERLSLEVDGSGKIVAARCG